MAAAACMLGANNRWVQVIAQDTGGPSSATGTAAHLHPSSSRGQHHSLSRRALLRDIMRLCMFFGQETTLELLIPILNTFFNDKVGRCQGQPQRQTDRLNT